MKRKLSLLMVLMMVLTLIPMSAFASAATSGKIEVHGYRSDLTLNSFTGKAGGGITDVPALVFDNSTSIDGSALDLRPISTTTTFTIKLTESNARFVPNTLLGDAVTYPAQQFYPYTFTDASGGKVDVEKLADDLIQVTYAPPAYVPASPYNESFAVPFFMQAIGYGEIKAKVDYRLSGFKDVNVLKTLAAIQKSASTIVVDRVGNIARNNSIVETSTETARIRIVENVNTAWKSAQEVIEIRLDGSDFTFGATKMRIDNVDFTDFEVLEKGKTLRIDPKKMALHSKYSSNFRNELVIDAPIRVARGTEVGKEVKATVRGEISPTSIVIAKYTDYAIEIKAEKVLDVVAGQDVPGRYVAKLTIEEMIPGSLLDGRVLEVSLPANVAAYQYGEVIRLDKVKGTGDINIDGSTVSKTNTKLVKSALVDKVRDWSLKGAVQTDEDKAKRNGPNRVMEIEINRGSNIPDNNTTGNKPNNLAAKYELTVPFVVATNFTGDLNLKFKGAGVGEQDVKIATVKAPVTVEIAKKGDLNIGQQNQDAPDVLIKETAAGALLEKDVVRDHYNEYGIVDSRWDSAGVTRWGGAIVASKIETKVKLNDSDYDQHQSWFAIDTRTKDTPGEFLVTNTKVTLDRTVPYGPFNIKIDAGNVNDRHGLTDIIEEKVFFNVVTPHPTDSDIKTVFTIGETGYVQTISGLEQKFTMDVAPQIMNNRTMMPIRYVADALGAKVNYDAGTRTAIFSKDAIVVSMTLDSNIMYVNGSPVVMDAAPVVQNSRALVSLVNVAQAFGLNSVSAPATGDIVYDAAAKTVTLFPNAQ